MSTWAVVPAKRLDAAKSRLAPVLTAEARARLAEQLLVNLLRTLGRAPDLAGVLVATNGDDVATIATDHGARVVRDVGSGSLADVVDRALTRLADDAVDRAVVVMADLPLVTPADVTSLTNACLPGALVAAPDDRRCNTNALATELRRRPRTCFGTERSFDRHRERATEHALEFRPLLSARLAFDVDTPADYQRWISELGARSP